MPEPIVQLRQVRKTYRQFSLDSLDFEMAPGRVCGLVGPNGAGKSTLLRILMGLVVHDSGLVRVMGREMPREQAAIKQAIGFVSEDMRLHPSRDLRWHADLVRSFHPGWDEARARTLAERFELSFGQRGAELSRGQAVKAALLLALAHRPRLLLLDEPTAGLDPLMRAELLDELARVVREEGLSVLFSSHVTGDVETIADDVAFLLRGRLVESGPRECVLAGGESLDAAFLRRAGREAARALNRCPLARASGWAIVYALAALVGAALVATRDEDVRSLGVSLIMGTLIGQCFHLPIVGVFHDITRGTRAFTLSLPVTPAEYAAGKLLANGLLFLIPAGAATLAVLATPADQRLFATPLVLLMLLGWLIFFFQNLGIALVTESMGITIVALLGELFVVGNGSMVLAPRIPGMLRVWGQLEGGGPIRDFAFVLMAFELAGVIALILFLMNRKRRFV
ncbi:MAG: ABC transporter ATP-binding protein [Candidatus Eisenbacteria bacterium]|nr:ABC transporter ATP-binding protein [Candidatus Eisenbacteria bacterium]